MKKILFLIATFVILLGVSACKPQHVHTPIYNEAIAPTCTDDGKEGYWYCEDCQTKFWDEDCQDTVSSDEQLKIEATGHGLSYTEGEEETCTKDGNREYWYCDDCDTYFLDADATQPTTQDALVISQKAHADENNDYICDYDCGKVLFAKEQLQTIINNALSSTKVTLKETYIPGAENNTYYFDENLLYLNDGYLESYYCTENGFTYVYTKSDEWTKETTSESITYNISHVLNDRFNFDIDSEIIADNCTYGIFDGHKMFKFKNALGLYVMIKLNADGTLLEEIYICDEYNNIIYTYQLIYGENEQVLDAFKEISDNMQG